MGLFSEDGSGGPDCDCGESGVCQSGGRSGNPCGARGFALFHPDLLRFCGVFGDRHRLRKSPWLPGDTEFYRAVSVGIRGGILAALAHFAVHLVPGLSLYSAWRKPAGHRAKIPQHSDCFCGVGALARSGLYLPVLGLSPRNLSGGRVFAKAHPRRPCTAPSY